MELTNFRMETVTTVLAYKERRFHIHLESEEYLIPNSNASGIKTMSSIQPDGNVLQVQSSVLLLFDCIPGLQ